MANEKINLKDTEISYWLIAGSFFTLVTIICEAFYKNLGDMFVGPDLWGGIVLVILNILIIVGWVITIKNWQDEAYDIWRILVTIFCAATISLVLAHRNQWLSQKQFEEHMKAIKQEQVK